MEGFALRLGVSHRFGLRLLHGAIPSPVKSGMMRPRVHRLGHQTERRTECQSGSALVGSVVFLFILTLTGLGYLGFGMRESEAIHRDYEDMQLRWLAEEALSLGLARANSKAAPDDTVLPAVDTGEYPARYRIHRLDDVRFPRFAVTSYVYRDNFSGSPECSLAAVIQAGSPASKYFYLDDHTNGVYFYTGDTIDGPIHTNTRFAIAGTPIFLDKTFEMGEVEKGYITHPDFQSTPILASGKPQGGKIYRFDHMADLIRGVSGGQRIRVDPNQVLAIEFKGPIMEMSYRDRAQPGVYTNPLARVIPKEGGLFVEGDVEVKGILSKTLTLGASGDITITDDLVYSGSDLVTGKPKSGSNVHLGLIAERNVEVKPTQLREEAGRGIRINASVVAMDSSFQISNTSLMGHSWDLGTMHFWGTIAQVARGQIGAEKAHDQFRGYHKDWHFDRRLLGNPMALPYFPALRAADGVMELTPVWYGGLDWMDHV